MPMMLLSGQLIGRLAYINWRGLIGPSGILLHPMMENLIAEKVNDRWEICVSLTEGQFQQYLQRALAKLKDHNNYQAGAASPVNADSQLDVFQHLSCTTPP
ncbi:hypothetical protein ACSBR1_020140 [Camellia fascicularis]